MSCGPHSGDPCRYVWPDTWGPDYRPGSCYYCGEPETTEDRDASPKSVTASTTETHSKETDMSTILPARLQSMTVHQFGDEAGRLGIMPSELLRRYMLTDAAGAPEEPLPTTDAE